MKKICFIALPIVIILSVIGFNMRSHGSDELDKYIQEKYPNNIELSSVDTTASIKFVLTKNETANLFTWIYNQEKNFTEIKWGTSKHFYILRVGEYCKVQSLDERGCILVASDKRKMKVSIFCRSEIDLPDGLAKSGEF